VSRGRIDGPALFSRAETGRRGCLL